MVNVGAEQFEARSRQTDVDAAFRECVENARYEDGHGGYTGTIAEKSEYVIWHGAPTTEGALVLLRTWCSSGAVPAGVPVDIYRAYDDKWGPAVAVADDVTGGWVFCGWASS
jgi:hypothetical protein